jgi:hypothetical protein
MRETEGGLSKLLDRPGPEGRGDNGHAYGLMGIDDRSFPDFCKGEKWKDPASNIDEGAWRLSQKREYLHPKLVAIGFTDTEIEQACIASYNCGEGNVMKSVLAGQDVDSRTTHGDYSRCVLEFADEYFHLGFS